MERYGKRLGQGLAVVVLTSVAVVAGAFVAGIAILAVRAMAKFVL